MNTTNTSRFSATADSHGPGPALMTASTLEGDKVVNLQGETLGTLDEIMIDVSNGRVAYAVMSSGGFLGLGDRLFALPWNALILDPARRCFVMDADKSRFKDAPGFDKDHWPQTPQGTLNEEIHSFWGISPYWS